MQTRVALASALLVLVAASGHDTTSAATLGEPVSAFAANVGVLESGAETPASATLFVVPDGRTFLLTDVLVANHSEEVGPLYLSDSKNTRCSIALLQMILLPGNPSGFSSFLNAQATFSTGIPFGPGEPVVATLARGTRGVDVTITGRLVSGPRLRPVRLPGGARDTGDDTPNADSR